MWPVLQLVLRKPSVLVVILSAKQGPLKDLTTAFLLLLLSLVDARIRLCSQWRVLRVYGWFDKAKMSWRNAINVMKSKIKKIRKYQKIKFSTYNWRWILEMVTEGVWNVKMKRDTEEVGSLKATKNKKDRCWSIGPRRKAM